MNLFDNHPLDPKKCRADISRCCPARISLSHDRHAAAVLPIDGANVFSWKGPLTEGESRFLSAFNFDAFSKESCSEEDAFLLLDLDGQTVPILLALDLWSGGRVNLCIQLMCLPLSRTIWCHPNLSKGTHNADSTYSLIVFITSKLYRFGV